MQNESSFNVKGACIKDVTKTSYLHLIIMNTHEPKKNKEQLREFWNLAPDGPVPVCTLKILCLHNNTYSTTFTEINITSHFQIISCHGN